MDVTIDRDQCTSSAICEVIAPDIFVIREDGLADLVDASVARRDGSLVTCAVIPGREDAVREAAEQCPGECIFLKD